MPVVEEYLTSVLGLLRRRNSEELKFYLRVEPPLNETFEQLSQELKITYRDNKILNQKITKLLPTNEHEDLKKGDVWAGFLAFMLEYLQYLRDANFQDLVEAHIQLNGLANACITALSNATYGIIILPAAIQISQALARLAMTLDKRPDLKLRLRKATNNGSDESRKSLVEGTAESIQRAFTMCLSERPPKDAPATGIGRDGKPIGKKVGIYSFANLVLKLLFQCRKTRLANQLFTNISQQSPPLHIYSASQRVTYLYYLGRFYFSNGHFYRAQICLQGAYDQCHARCTSQRRLILIYLIASNLVLGRFPSRALMSRSEAHGLLVKFAPISKAIREGDLASFKRALGSESGNERWFFQKGLLLPLLYRCEVLVWRSLARRTFLLTYQFPTDPSSNKAPTLNLSDLVTAARYCQSLLEGWEVPVDSATVMQAGKTHTNAMFMKAPDLVLSATGAKVLNAIQGTVFGNRKPNMLEVECSVASLIQQGLLRGFISHNQGKFAILGAKQRGGQGPLKAGFPDVFEVMKTRAVREDKELDVPGWIRSERTLGMGGVVNLTGARPAGSTT